jgi:hypothetical protein
MFDLALVDRYRALYGDRASQLRSLHNAEQLVSCPGDFVSDDSAGRIGVGPAERLG